MESRIEKTQELHDKGYNCAQAVACTYCDLVGIEPSVMFRMAEGLGLGMGCTEGTCGAISGAVLLAGCKNSTCRLDVPNSKAATYQLSKALVTRFQEQNGATLCKELKGIQTGTVLRSCPDCIRDAARIVEDVLFAEEFK